MRKFLILFIVLMLAMFFALPALAASHDLTDSGGAGGLALVPDAVVVLAGFGASDPCAIQGAACTIAAGAALMKSTYIDISLITFDTLLLVDGVKYVRYGPVALLTRSGSVIMSRARERPAFGSVSFKLIA